MSFENKSYPLSTASRLACALVSFALLLGLAAGQASATAYENPYEEEHESDWDDRGDWEWPDHSLLALGRFGHRKHHDHDDYDHRPGHPQGPMDRLTLYDLVIGGESFDSRNGNVSFSNFEADLGDHGDRILKKYTVKPVGHGFELLGPTFSIFGYGKDLAFSYDVTASDGLEINEVKLGVMGFGLGGKAGAKMHVSDDEGEELGSLRAISGKRGHHGRHRGSNHDRLVLENAVAGLQIDEKLFAKGLLAASWKTKHSFKTQVIPEPGTALLFGLGLTGLGYAGRRKA